MTSYAASACCLLLLLVDAVSASGLAVAGSTALQLNAKDVPSSTLQGGFLAQAMSHDVEDDTANALAALYTGSPSRECKIYCEGKEVGKNGAPTNDEKVHSCWGDLKLFCKWSKNGTEEEGSACGVVGLKCEGHWVHMPREGHTIVVCDGLLKRFAKTVVTSSKGESATVFKAGGCLGTGIGVMAKRGNASFATEKPYDELPGDAIVSKVDRFLEDKNLAPVVEDLWAGSETTETLFESRCDGPGGKVLAVRRLEGAGGLESLGSFEDNEAEAVKAVMEFDFPKPAKASRKLHHGHHHLWKHALLKHLPFFHHGHKKHRLGGRDITCTKLCNGKTPWFHGALPCFGVASLHCSGTFDPSKLLKHHKCGKQARKEATAVAVAAVSEPFHFDYSATCKGMFSGIFGAKCYGFASEHQAFTEVDKYEYCTGKQGQRFKMRHGAFAMGKWCKGKSLMAVQKTGDSAAGAKQGEMVLH